MTREVGLLTTREHPLLSAILDELSRHPGLRPLLLFDRRGLTATDIARFAARTNGAFPPRAIPADIERIEVPDHNAAELRDVLRERGISTLANAGTPRRIGRNLLAAATGGIVNAHPGILPRYRGASSPEWAIYNDDPVGVTAHFMDEGLDSGPIIATVMLDLPRGADYVAMRVAMYRLTARVLADAILRVVREGLTPDRLPPQPHAPALRPIPDDRLLVVKERLARGEYRHAR